MTTTATRPGILRDGRLGGADPEALAMRFGTPYYAYDLDVVTAQIEALRAVLPASFDLAFAVKANPLLALLRHLAALGLGADVASGGELRHVLRAGFDGGRVVFTGPGKRDEELRGGSRGRRQGGHGGVARGAGATRGDRRESRATPAGPAAPLDVGRAARGTGPDHR